VAHVIEISSPVLRQNNEVVSTLAANQAKSTILIYVKKAFRRETWRKLINGEIHFEAVWRNITRPMKRFMSKKGKKSTPTPHAAAKTQRNPFGSFHGQMLLIHGEKDPETKPALEQIHKILHRCQVTTETYIIKNANHSFYSITWEKEIIRLIEDWLGRMVTGYR
jgi:pimeloyl-ACP methyl ester carboxylesterase